MVAALTIVLVVPFERALLTLPGGLTLTTSEAAAVIALCTAAICLIAERRITWPAPLLRPGMAFATALLLAALAAPTEPGNALRFVGRMAAAAAVCVLFVNVATTTARARAIVRVLVGIAMLIGAIAVLERAEIPGVMAVLTWFRPGFHVVAGQLRGTSTLLYPTIASMYLEVAFALGLWLLLEPTSRRPRLERSIAFAALVVIAAGIVATFTRAGLIGLFTSLLLVGAIRIWRLPAGQRQLRPLAALGATIVVVILLTHSIDRFAIRLGTEGSQAWYGARYQVPSALRLQAGNIDSIPITLTNTGRLTWYSISKPPFAM